MHTGNTGPGSDRGKLTPWTDGHRSQSPPSISVLCLQKNGEKNGEKKRERERERETETERERNKDRNGETERETVKQREHCLFFNSSFKNSDNGPYNL